jgi:hypothetical protein
MSEADDCQFGVPSNDVPDFDESVVLVDLNAGFRRCAAYVKRYPDGNTIAAVVPQQQPPTLCYTAAEQVSVNVGMYG